MRHSLPPNQKPDICRFHQDLSQLGIDTDSLYRQLGLDPDVMAAENTSIDFLKYLELLELAASESQNRFLAMDMVLNNRNENLGLLTYMLRNASTFETALELLHRYVILVSPNSFTSLIRQDGDCILTYKLNTSAATVCQQDVEGTITQFILMVRSMLQDDNWNPKGIYFEHEPPTKEELSTIPIKGEIAFNHFFNGIRFDEALLKTTISDCDPKLLALLESQARLTAENLSANDTFIKQLRLLISSKLGAADVTADLIAGELGMSRRTLNRRLNDLNTTFNTEREDIVFHLAKQNLVNSDTSVTELAQSLGYSDSSAFNRAFKRLSDKTPLEYRKSHRSSR